MDNFVFYILIFAIVCTAVTGFSFAIEPRRLLNGLLINMTIAVDLMALGGYIIASNNQWLIIPSAIAFILVVGIITLFFLLHLVWLIWNAIIVWRRERHALQNMLTLLIAVALIGIDILGLFGAKFLPDYLYGALLGLTTSVGMYISLTLLNFLTALVAYNLRRPLHDQDFLIVLGAGLLGGDRVGKLLGARIDVAIKYYQKQAARGHKTPTIIFSGGQGRDEKLSEAAAMQQYAIARGIPASATVLEDQSRTTLENMHFSAQIIRELTGGQKYRAQFCTNNYHLFRAGLFAREAGLNANGLGAKTALYYLPNATIREYVAILMLNKRRHIITLAALCFFPALGIILGLLTR